MREIVLDTETTGLDPKKGHRLVEIACVELWNKERTGRFFHCYINPERDMPEDAFRVHGLSAEFLRQHPIFSAVANDFEDFVNQSTLVIHNAGFDMKFIHHAFGLLGRDFAAPETIVDTLMMARRRFPGASATLDALCKRFGVNAKNRVKHGALIDAELLADVYIAMTAPRTAQKSLQLDPPPSSVFYVAGPPLKPEDQEMRAASDEERQRHHQFLASIGIDHWPHIQTENQSI